MKIIINIFSLFSTVGQLHFWIDTICTGCDLRPELKVGKEAGEMSFERVRKVSLKTAEVSGKIVIDFSELYIRPLVLKWKFVQVQIT